MLSDRYLQTRLNVIKARAKIKKREVTLTVNDILAIIENNCHYCGISNEYGYHSIDRVDNEKGYTKDNCVACCSVCNTAKNALSVVHFKKWIIRIFFNCLRTGFITKDMFYSEVNAIESIEWDEFCRDHLIDLDDLND